MRKEDKDWFRKCNMQGWRDCSMVRALDVLVKTPVQILAPRNGTPVTEDLLFSFDLHRYQAHNWYTYTHKQNIRTYKINK